MAAFGLFEMAGGCAPPPSNIQLCAQFREARKQWEAHASTDQAFVASLKHLSDTAARGEPATGIDRAASRFGNSITVDSSTRDAMDDLDRECAGKGL